jgi:hypothetical protein
VASLFILCVNWNHKNQTFPNRAGTIQGWLDSVWIQNSTVRFFSFLESGSSKSILINNRTKI